MRTTLGLVAALVVVAGVSGCDPRRLEVLPGNDAGAPTTEYRWGDVSIHVAPTGAITGNMTLSITDRRNPAAMPSTWTYPPATTSAAPTGAWVVARHSCGGDPTLFAAEIYSCILDGSTGAPPPGCLFVSLEDTPRVTGTFVNTNGTRCDIKAGSADITLPRPAGLANGVTEAASGRFLLPCRGSDGTDLELEGSFLLPQVVLVLAC